MNQSCGLLLMLSCVISAVLYQIYFRVLTQQSLNQEFDVAGHFQKEFPCLEPTVNGCNEQYEFAQKVNDLWNSAGRPWFLMGGTPLNLLRFGTVSLFPNTVNDDDFDGIMIYESDEDMEKIVTQLEQSEKNVGFGNRTNFHWRSCLKMVSMDVHSENLTKGALYHSMMYKGLNYNTSHLLIQANNCDPWFVLKSKVFPFKKVKYGDIVFHVPNDFIYFYSHYPVDSARNNSIHVHYGQGCFSLGFPNKLYALLWAGERRANKFKFNRYDDAHSYNFVRKIDALVKTKGHELSKLGFANFYEECFTEEK